MLLNFVPYFTEEIADSVNFLKKGFRNGIGSGLRSILIRSCGCVLIANTFISSNRSLDEDYSDC
jgi:hypothetical protein